MSGRPENSSDLHLHINDLEDIIASIKLDRSEHIESVWYEFWDSVLNYWARYTSDRMTRLSVAPQRQIVREILLDDAEELDPDWSFQADAGDTSIDLCEDPPSIQQRIREAHNGVSTQSRIPDFTAFTLRRNGLPHRHLACIIEIKPSCPSPHLELPGAALQILTQAKFAFDTFPTLRHVRSIAAFGDMCCLLQFPRDEMTQVYLERVEGWKDDDTFDPERAATRTANIDISRFIVIPFTKVLTNDGSNYTSAFKRAIRLITSDL